MPAMYAKRLAAALVVVASLSLSAEAYLSSAFAQTAGTATTEDSARVIAAREFLEAIGFKSNLDAKFPAVAGRIADSNPGLRYTNIDVRQVVLKILQQSEPDLEDQVAKLYATNFTTEELDKARDFYRTETGVLYSRFNREMNASPYTTPEIMRSEVGKRFSPEQRAEVFNYLRDGVGQKMLRMLPDLLKAEKELTSRWGHKADEAIGRAVLKASSSAPLQAS